MSVFNHSPRSARKVSQGPRRECPRYLWTFLTLTCILIALVGCKAKKPGSSLACPGQIAASEEAANRVETRVRQARRNGGPVRITVTDEEATSYLHLRRRVIPLRNVVVCFQPNQIRLGGRFVLGKRAEYSVQAALTASVDDGVAQVHANSITVNGFALPRWARTRIERPMNDALADARRHFRVEEVTPGEGSLLIVGSIE
jgi:hypothetical protein